MQAVAVAEGRLPRGHRPAGRGNGGHGGGDGGPEAAVPGVVLAGDGDGPGVLHGELAGGVDHLALHGVHQAGRQADVAVVGEDDGAASALGDETRFQHGEVDVQHVGGLRRGDDHAGELGADGALAELGQHGRAGDPDAVDDLLRGQRGVVAGGDDADALAARGEALSDVPGEVGQPGHVGRVVGQRDDQVVVHDGPLRR